MTKEDLDLRDPEWLAEQLGIEKNTIYKYLNDGVLPALKLGRKWLVSQADVIQFLIDERVKQTAQRRLERWVIDGILRLDDELLVSDGPDAASELVARLADDLSTQLGDVPVRVIPDVVETAQRIGAFVGRCPTCKSGLVIWTRAAVNGLVEGPECPSCAARTEEYYAMLWEEEVERRAAEEEAARNASRAEIDEGKEEMPIEETAPAKKA